MAFRGFFAGVNVIVTGHTGFKGSWLSQWLKSEGANVAGISLAPEDNGQPNLFTAADIGKGMVSSICDIRDFARLQTEVNKFNPDIIFHLAAQSLVRRSYRDPLGTFSTNIMGTANVLEAARACHSVRAVVCVTTDKCYENREWVWGYRESDSLGGKDPYSASKAAAEIVAHGYRQSLLQLDGDRIAMATARGGNVLGGGDWSEDRLVPDLIRFINTHSPIILRNPDAIRPWQHVLDLLGAYLHLGQLLLDRPEIAAGAWNFGPERGNEVTVENLTTRFVNAYAGSNARVEIVPSQVPEATTLKLDITKARSILGWTPRLDIDRTIAMTASWYRGFHREQRNAAVMMADQIDAYMQLLA
jgi:CDP-glucose 4,6-dehydratase